jgi:hypothetical protein
VTKSEDRTGDRTPLHFLRVLHVLHRVTVRLPRCSDIGNGRTWDRTRPKGKRLGATRGDSGAALQGDSGSSGDSSERSETTCSDSALGQETDDDPDLDDDPRSQRGPSQTTESTAPQSLLRLTREA